MTIAPRTPSLLLLLALCLPAAAQTPAPAAAQAGARITVTLTASGVRFAAHGSVTRMRLEVFGPAGEPVYGSGFLAGNVRDWAPRDAQGAPLPDGAYTCVVTAREAGGGVSTREGVLLLSGGQASIQLGGGGTVADEKPVRATLAADAGAEEGGGALTVVAHDGRDGQVTSTAGALTFRTGDFFAGEDRERVRITPEGRIGIGTDSPADALDVAGAVRAAGGFKFSDGTTLSARDGRLTLTDAQGGELATPALASAAATAGRLAKFDAGGALVDSAVTESGGLVGIGTASPSTPLDVVYNDNAFGFGVNIRNTNTGPQALVGYGINSSGGSRVGQFVYVPPTYVVTALRDSILFSSAGPTAQLGFVSSADGSGTPDIYVRAGGNSPDSIFVKGSTRNVGFGTSAPTERLDVIGKVKITGAGNGVIFPDGITQTAAAGSRLISTGDPSSPNVIGGSSYNNVTTGVVGATIGGGGAFLGNPINEPLPNRVTDNWGTVGGGELNTAGNDLGTLHDSSHATVAGGYNNRARGKYSAVGGGYSNEASGGYSTAGGGDSNTVSGEAATVSGGDGNHATNTFTTVGGGRANTATGFRAVVSGGEINHATNYSATVGGGYSNNAGGGSSTIPGGSFNTASGDNSFAAGLRAKAVNQGAFIWADSTDADFTSTAANQFLVRASGGVGINTTGTSAATFSVSGSGLFTGNVTVDTSTLFVNSTTDRVGVGTASPGARLHVSGGDAAVTTQGNGIILRATDGAKCFRVTVSNTGTLTTTEVTCP